MTGREPFIPCFRALWMYGALEDAAKVRSKRGSENNMLANGSWKYVRSEMGDARFSEDELRVYFGPNADYYIAAWHAENSGDGRTRLNWTAFFFSTPWLLYRKLYSVAALHLAVWAAVGTILFVSAEYDVPFLVLNAVIVVVNLLMCFVLGINGNSWYLGKARRTLERIRSIEPVQEARLQALRKQGGISIIAPIIITVIPGLLAAVLTTLDWSEYGAIDQSQMSLKATETETVYHNPKYGATLRLPGDWHTRENNPAHFCDLENPDGSIAFFFPEHDDRTLENYYRVFKQKTRTHGYKIEGESDFMVGSTQGKQLLVRTADGNLFVMQFVKKGFTVYLLEVGFTQPEVGEGAADKKHRRDEVLRSLPQAVGIN